MQGGKAILIVGMRRQGGGGTRVGQGLTSSDGPKDRTVLALVLLMYSVLSQAQWYTLIRRWEDELVPRTSSATGSSAKTQEFAELHVSPCFAHTHSCVDDLDYLQGLVHP